MKHLMDHYVGFKHQILNVFMSIILSIVLILVGKITCLWFLLTNGWWRLMPIGVWMTKKVYLNN